MKETWNECTMSVLTIITVKTKYPPGAFHGSDMFPPEARAGAKLMQNADVTT